MKKIAQFFKKIAMKIAQFFVTIYNRLMKTDNELLEEKKVALVKLFNEEVKLLQEKWDSLNAKLTPEKIQELKGPSLITSPDGKFKIRIEKHPNRDVLSFHTSIPLFTEGSCIDLFDFPVISYGKDITPDRKKIVEKIYKTQMCVHMCLQPFKLSFTKSGALNWNEISPKVVEIIFNFLAEKYPNA